MFRKTPERPAHPESVGPYRIVEVLGTGGMGVVYNAEDSRLGRRVALKTLSAASRDPAARDRLWREARAAAALSHPGICQVYDVAEHDGELYVAMELLEGEGLDQRLKGARFGVEEAVRLALDVLAALGVLHDRGVIHRDLKPSNIFLTRHGPKILDFGLALPLEGPTDTRLTGEGMIIGTPHYMAPEQWRAEGLGARSDLFAMGAILYEILAGEYAFPGEDPIAVFHACAFESPLPLTGAPGIEAVNAVIRRPIAKDPAERPADAAEMARELTGALERMRTLQTPDATPPVERKAETVRRFIALPFRMLRADPDLDFLASSLPEAIGGLSLLARVAARADLTELGLDLIDPMVEAGFNCVAGLQRDPWLSMISDEPRYQDAIGRAQAARVEAAEFRDAGGEEILGVKEPRDLETW
jgi:serine/threonine protein kinase